MWIEVPEFLEYSPNWKHFTELKLKSRNSYNCDYAGDGVTRGRELHELHTAYYRPNQTVARRQQVAHGEIWSDKTPYNPFHGKVQIEHGIFF